MICGSPPCPGGSKAEILEEAFESAGGERHREANTLGTIGPPGVRTDRQKNQITRRKNEGKIRRPNDCLALDQFKNLILPVMNMARRPEAGRSAIVKNGELPPLSAGPIRMCDSSPQDVRDTMPDDAALSIEIGCEVIVLEDTPVPFFC